MPEFYTISKREYINSQREAYVHGARQWGHGLIRDDLVWDDAEKLYPYPVEKRRRVVTNNETGYQYRVSENGLYIEFRIHLEHGWSNWLSTVPRKHYEFFKDLFENPDEEVK